jgi:hypothetical protein
MLTAWLHSAWVKEVKNVQFVPAVQGAPAYALYNVAVVPLQTPAIRRKRCESQPVGELKQCAPQRCMSTFLSTG